MKSHSDQPSTVNACVSNRIITFLVAKLLPNVTKVSFETNMKTDVEITFTTAHVLSNLTDLSFDAL